MAKESTPKLSPPIKEIHRATPADIAIMLDDMPLVRLVSCWPKLTDAARQDVELLAIVANILPQRIEDTLLRAKANRLIYDDGTVNEFAEKYISTLIGERIGKARKNTRAQQSSP